MLPQKNQDGPLHSGLVRWIRRIGPAWCLVLTLCMPGLLLVGCYAISERVPWRAPRQKPDPPVVNVNRMVRVRLLGRKPKKQVPLSIACPFNISDAVSGRLIQTHDRPLDSCTARPASGSGIALGRLLVPNTDLIISPSRDASLVVNKKTYRGLLRIQRRGNGLVFTNHVDVESYLRGVLRGELPRDFAPESFKAQCVAARTYVLYQMDLRPPDSTFDVYDDEGSQMYIGVLGEDTKAVRAVEETRGEVCVWDDGGRDSIFCTYYSSTCGGRSQHVNNFKPADPEVPPLAGGVECGDCYLARFYEWGPVKLSKDEVTRRIVARYPSIERLGKIIDVKPKSLTEDGRIVRVHLQGENGKNETLVGEDFRLSVGGRTLKSTCFQIESRGNQFVFRDGRGFGHGVGLCQHGMEAKARRHGMDYKRILAFYYPTSKVKAIY